MAVQRAKWKAKEKEEEVKEEFFETEQAGSSLFDRDEEYDYEQDEHFNELYQLPEDNHYA